MTMNNAFSSLAGKLLIAMPNMDDKRFEKAVIYLSAHTADTGAMGIIINRPADKISFFDLLEQMSIPHAPAIAKPDILIGGPDQLTRGFILHSDDYQAENLLSSHNHISLTTSERILLDVAAGIGPKHLLLALGCATWVDGQLEEEIMSNVWLTTDATSELLFETPYEERWEKALTSIGISLPLLASQYGKA